MARNSSTFASRGRVWSCHSPAAISGVVVVVGRGVSSTIGAVVVVDAPVASMMRDTPVAGGVAPSPEVVVVPA